MTRAIITLAFLLAVAAPALGQAPQALQPVVLPPNVAVTGRGEASARPDHAVVRLGAIAQADKASDAQRRVNERVQQVLEQLKALGIPEERIQTVGLMLSPVYDQQQRPGRVEQEIVGYQATNTIQVRLDDITRIGEVIDAALGAGANHLEGVWFELKDDAEQRREALHKAVAEARQKAEAIAAATGTRLDGILEITEGGVDVFRPMMMQRAMAFEAGAEATPVQPGEVRVEATVTIRYRLGGA